MERAAARQGPAWTPRDEVCEEGRGEGGGVGGGDEQHGEKRNLY